MGAVDVGVGHDDDLVVAEFFQVKLLAADAGAEGGDELFDLLGTEDFVEARLFHIHNLAAQGQDGLDGPVTPLFGRTAGGITLDDEQFAFCRDAALAFGQLTGHHHRQAALLARQVAGLARRVTRPGRLHHLAEDGARYPGVLFQVGTQFLVAHGLDNGFDLRVAELGFRLPLELGIGYAYADNAGQPFAHIITAHFFPEVFGHHVVAGVAVDALGERGAEAGHMGTALTSIDVVDKGEEPLRIPVKILKADLHLDIVALAGDENGLTVHSRAVAVQILDIGGDAAVIKEGILGAIAFVLEEDADIAVKEGEFPHSRFDDFVFENRGLAEYFRVRKKGDARAGGLAGANLLEVAGASTVFVGLAVNFPVAPDLGRHSAAQGVDHTHTNAVQTTRYLVAGVVELAARVQGRQDQFQGGHVFGGVLVHRDTATIVLHRHPVILVNNHADGVTVAGHGLVNGVVHHLVDKVVQPLLGGIADVHGRSFADSLQTVKDLDLFRSIRFFV